MVKVHDLTGKQINTIAELAAITAIERAKELGIESGPFWWRKESTEEWLTRSIKRALRKDWLCSRRSYKANYRRVN
jgi:hypothetical protein